MTDARDILDHHREWKGIIKKFIIDILSIVTLGLISTRLGLFAQTDSAKKLSNFEQSLTNNLVN